MSPTVRKAERRDLYPVYELLRSSTLNSSWVPLDVRRRMFEPVWGGKEEYFGYVLEDGPVVGFLGLLFTEREVRGKPHRFCELHSWYVRDEYRNESIKLLLPALSMKNVTLLNYTPTKPVYEISVKFGFQDLEKKLLLVYPVPTPGALRMPATLLSERHEVSASLEGADRVIFNDHAHLDCMHFVLKGRAGETCYFLMKRMQRRWFEPFGRVLYVGDRRLFLEALPYLRVYLCLRYGLQCLVLDQGDLEGERVPFSRVIDREVPSLIKSRTVEPQDMKPLYTLPLLLGYKLH
ncbi:hypothetical protein WMF37_34165 [Sorangium sp. So ce291]|uniref:hypothetical protein n=1 Tax=Sorangium sp. So ce291 TaxID=3133294 RepID=UPI003F5EC66F